MDNTIMYHKYIIINTHSGNEVTQISEVELRSLILRRGDLEEFSRIFGIRSYADLD